jgi:hypothetical protein
LITKHRPPSGHYTGRTSLLRLPRNGHFEPEPGAPHLLPGLQGADPPL